MVNKNLNVVHVKIERYLKLAGEPFGTRFNLFKFVARHHDANVMSEAFQCFRKGARDIREPAGFCIRHYFRCRQ